MFAKTTSILAFLAIAARVVVATPPACLLAAVNTTPNPGDIKAVCNASDKVVSYIGSNCGGQQQAALSAFQSVCSNAGVTISTSISSSVSGSASASASVSTATASLSGVITAPTSLASGVSGSIVSATGSPSGTFGIVTVTPTSTALAGGSGSTSSTTSATAQAQTGAAVRLGMDVVGMAAMGAFGAMLAL